MEIKGIVDQVFDRSKAPFKKAILVLRVESINNISVEKTSNTKESNCISIEFRKHLSVLANAFKPGDYINVVCSFDFKIDEYKNCYNNYVAKNAVRL